MVESAKPLQKKPVNRKKRIWLIAALLVCITVPLLARAWVDFSARGRICHSISQVPNCRVALVLGARVKPNGDLSLSLASRCDRAIQLYKAGKVQKLLMSGDNRFKNYNEPDRMRDYAVAHGVPAADVATDYAGRRTYDSIYRAKHIFGLNKLIIVTQRFHMPRAIFLARVIGLDACGITSAIGNNLKADIRETPACVSALLDAYVWTPKPILDKEEKI